MKDGRLNERKKGWLVGWLYWKNKTFVEGHVSTGLKKRQRENTRHMHIYEKKNNGRKKNIFQEEACARASPEPVSHVVLSPSSLCPLQSEHVSCLSDADT